MINYPLLAAKPAKLEDETYMPTDSDNIQNIA
jgi:hypothetical protein